MWDQSTVQKVKALVQRDGFAPEVVLHDDPNHPRIQIVAPEGFAWFFTTMMAISAELKTLRIKVLTTGIWIYPGHE